MLAVGPAGRWACWRDDVGVSGGARSCADARADVEEDRPMTIIVVTAIRLLGDGLVACFHPRPEIDVIAVVDGLTALRAALDSTPCDLVLIDVTQGIDLYDVRRIALEHSEVALVAL